MIEQTHKAIDMARFLRTSNTRFLTFQHSFWGRWTQGESTNKRSGSGQALSDVVGW